MALTQESVLSFLLERGGKAKNSELLNNFRSVIGGTDPAERQHNRDLFKRLVNSVAVVQQIDGAKFVVVRKRYQDFVKEAAHDASRKPPADDSQNQNTVLSRTPPPRPAGAPACRMIRPDDENNNTRDKSLEYATPTPAGSVRDREASSRDSCGADTAAAVKVLSLSADQTCRVRKSGAVFAVIAVKSPTRDSTPATHGGLQTRVRQSKSADKPIKLRTKVSTPSPPSVNPRKKGAQKSVSHCREGRQAEDPQPRPPNRTPKQGDDAKYPDCVPLEPLAHEWLVKCAAGQWGRIHVLLLQDARVAQRKDFMSGFTALHWAAKGGDCGTIRKLVDVSAKGGVRLDVNSKAHGGYTPLHVAAIHGRNEAMAVLVQSYGASVGERDNSGKRASHYLGKGAPAEVRALLGGAQQQQQQQQGQSKERGEDEECREHGRGLNTISKLFQPHVGKRQKTTTRFSS